MMRLRAVTPKVGQPAIRPQIFSLIPVSSPGLGTTKVDRRSRVYIDFDLLMSLGVEVATKYLIHEAWHILRDHMGRGARIPRGKFNAWNVAADCEINDDIPGVPDNFYLPESIGCESYLTAEHYFLTARNVIPDDIDGDGDDGNSEGDEAESGDGASKSGSPGQQGKQKSCGSGAGNAASDTSHELSDDEAPVRTETQQQVARMITAENMLRDGGQRGDGSANDLINWARTVKGGKRTPWQKLLQGAVSRAVEFKMGESEVSWSRRSLIADSVPEAILPGSVDPKITMAIAVDVSASNLTNMGRAANQIDQIMRRMDIKGESLQVFAVDTVAREPRFVHTLKDIVLKGGGGTDMRVAFQTITQMKGERKPNIGIIITDGETAWPDVKPRGHTIWIAVITPNRYNLNNTFDEIPKWIRKVIVNDEI